MKLKLFVSVMGLVLVQMLDAQVITGRVTCEGKGLANVVVTDGYDCVQTDGNGEYSLSKHSDARYISVSTPAGYLVENKDKTIPQFYKPIALETSEGDYDFVLQKNPLDDTHHVFTVQADVQVTSEKDIEGYGPLLKDMIDHLEPFRGKIDVFGFDVGDMVGDSPWLFPSYINQVSQVDLPIYRAIGNHDMTYGGRTYEYSYQKFEELFGPIYYSFNKGQAHYIVLNNCFYVNRDYQYIGYIDERTFAWMEKDLAYVSEDRPVFVLMHIPSCLTKELKWNTLIQDETSNAAGLYEILKPYQAHIISGHTHFNLNVCFNDRLMEHNTAAVSGIWWKAPICMDGTPVGYGVYDVKGSQVNWYYKSSGFPKEYQMRVYGTGISEEYPKDIIANVWNWDEQWKVEWYENGKRMGKMERYTGYDPEAKEICADKKRVEYDWIAPVPTEHLFHATPKDPKAEITVKVIDRFGNVYEEKIK